MTLNEKQIATFKAHWRQFKSNVTESFLNMRILKINKEHEHMDKLRENKEPKTKVIYANDKPESQLKKYSDATFIIVIILIVLALLKSN